ncbi:MAG: glycosyltransferase family 2 protein [Candidatus Pseudothioglobus sp.]
MGENNGTKKTNELITVIVTALNEEQFIGRCIRSLLAQTFQRDKYKIIVVNDGSTDRTSYALELFQEDITVIQNEKNLGLPASVNKAIQQVKTPYFVRVDADDYVSKHFLLFLYVFISENPNMDAVACDYNIIDDEGLLISKQNCFDNPIACGIIFHTNHIRELGMYDEKFLMHEERDLRIRFLKKYNMNRLQIPLYRYRKHSGSMTNDKQAMEIHLKKLHLKHSLDK